MKKILILIFILFSNNNNCYKLNRSLLTLNNWIYVLKIKKQTVLDNKLIISLPSPMKINDAFIYVRESIRYTNNARNCKRINEKLFNSICDRLDLKDMKIN